MWNQFDVPCVLDNLLQWGANCVDFFIMYVGNCSLLSFSSLSSLCLARKFHSGRIRILLEASKTKHRVGNKTKKKRERERERDLKVSFWVNFGEENPQPVSVVPLWAHGEHPAPSITGRSSCESDLNPLNSFTGTCNVGQCGEQCGIMCKLIHPAEWYESGAFSVEDLKPVYCNPKGNRGMNWISSQ